jgi:hypothetical protein
MWEDFTMVALGQLGIFLAFARLRGESLKGSTRLLLSSCVAGLGIGWLYDMWVGARQGVFAYELRTGWYFPVLNGFVSYGLALATVRVIIKDRISQADSSFRALVVVGAVSLTTMCLFLLFFYPTTGIVSTVLVAICILTLGELAHTGFRVAGPIACATGGQYWLFLTIWWYSVLVGGLYEILNFFFPVWGWNLSAGMPKVMQEILVVTFGYFCFISYLNHSCACYALIETGRTP